MTLGDQFVGAGGADCQLQRLRGTADQVGTPVFTWIDANGCAPNRTECCCAPGSRWVRAGGRWLCDPRATWLRSDASQRSNKPRPGLQYAVKWKRPYFGLPEFG